MILNCPGNRKRPGLQFRIQYFLGNALIIRTMKLTTLFILIACMQLNAAVYSQQVSLSYKGARLSAVLSDIKKQTGFESLYSTELMETAKPVDIQIQNENLRNALDRLFGSQPMDYEIVENNILIKAKANVAPKAVRQQPGRISGKVVDDRGEPLPGASVKIVQTNQAVQSSVDGTYSFSIAAGSYTIEVSYISFQTKRITQVEVKPGETTNLNIVLNPATNELSQVVVTGSFKKESVAGLYAQQKNAASVTDGISAEQIARTPDNDMGAALKRVTGLTTINNRSVVVRGMGDRYNQAMLDGLSIPSTSMNRRDFAFDIIPTEMVGSVVVNKTATPDVSAEFSGGQVNIRTMDIPTHNFTSIQIGSGFNQQSLGNDFYRMGERHTSEYFGFFDRSAQLPEGMQSWNFGNSDVPPPFGDNMDNVELIPGNGIPWRNLDAVAQSQRLSAEPLRLQQAKGSPNQNYRLSIGRVYDLKNGMRFGFSAAASLRNEQQVHQFNNVRGSIYGDVIHFIDSTKVGQNGAGTSYRFNSNSGLVANLGLQGEKFKVASKNMYARSLSDNFNEATRLNYADISHGPHREMYQLPEAMSLQQHQLSGEYALPAGIQATAMLGYTHITQRILDERKFKYDLTEQIGDDYYFQSPNVRTPAAAGTDALSLDSRMWTHINQQDFNWALGLSRSFGQETSVRTLLKAGYQGFDKQRDLSVFRMVPFAARESVFDQLYEVILDPANIGSEQNQAYYWAMNTNGPAFDGRMKSHAVYLMADQKLWNRLRLVYGVRGESFDLNNSQEELLERQYGPDPGEFISFRMGVKESGWRWLPSINATYELTPTFNIRSSYSRTVIRPDFRESSFFGFYDYELDANVSGDRVESTLVDNVDARLEWYPGPGEIISLTGYYKYLDRPIELIKMEEMQGAYYQFANMESATNLGLEMEVRKNLAFFGEQSWWEDLFVYANGTLLKSKVKTMSGWRPTNMEDGSTVFMQHPGSNQNRPLIGQSPWLLNLGIGYWGEVFGLTASYNQRGYRTNLTATEGFQVEYEKVPGQLDGQLYGRFLKRKMEVKLNLANLINDWAIYYANNHSYNIMVDGQEVLTEDLQRGDLRYSKKDDDTILYRRKEGRRFGLSVTYNF